MKEPIRTLVVDDEPLAREGIRVLLERDPDVEVVGECSNGSEAAAAIEELEPDLVFLDVQMPEMDGFEALGTGDDDTRPFVIFVTAYDTYAIRAFDVHAVDYLLKPFDDERFGEALERAKTELRYRRDAELAERVAGPGGAPGQDGADRRGRGRRRRRLSGAAGRQEGGPGVLRGHGRDRLDRGTTTSGSTWATTRTSCARR